MRNQIKFITCILLLQSGLALAQLNTFKYQREVKGVNKLWHKISLPKDVLSKTNIQLNDIRIYGITDEQDTIEAPFIHKVYKEVNSSERIDFIQLNQVENEGAYFFTFEVPGKEAVNQINLAFEESNFNRKVKLEGSNDQLNWYTLLDDYTIISFAKNGHRFAYTSLEFPLSKYKFFRIKVISKEKPVLNKAEIKSHHSQKGKFLKYKVSETRIENDKELNKTIISLDLKDRSRVSYLKINVKDTVNFSRFCEMKVLVDSIHTPKGWRYNYRNISLGLLSNYRNGAFEFPELIEKQLVIEIYNYDNEPLSIDSIEVKGYEHALITRLRKKADYFLVYGKENAYRPNYDIVNFQDKIPQKLQKLKIGEETLIDQIADQEKESFFKNPMLLWIIMGIVILLLGVFSIKMLKEK